MVLLGPGLSLAPKGKAQEPWEMELQPLDPKESQLGWEEVLLSAPRNLPPLWGAVMCCTDSGSLKARRGSHQLVQVWLQSWPDLGGNIPAMLWELGQVTWPL